jgi:putative multiple sugar transport system permease protein
MVRVKEFLSKNAMLVVLLLVMVLFETMIYSSTGGATSMFAPAHLTNLILQNGYVVILATGMLLCILTGGNIDLSVGSVVALVGAIAGVFIVNWGLNPYLSIFLCLLIGTAIGAWQAFWIAYVRIPPFVTTLAGMMMFRGLAMAILGGRPIAGFPYQYRNLFISFIPDRGAAGGSNLMTTMFIAIVICIIFATFLIISRARKASKGYEVDKLIWMLTRIVIISGVVLFVFSRLGANRGVPVLLMWLGAIVLIYNYYTQNTIPGRYLYAMGGNEKAARLSGINTRRMMFFAYTNMGFLSAFAALVMVARTNMAWPDLGDGFELDAIGACFIGGASAYGGVGKVGGAVIGAIFMGVLNMGMTQLGLDSNLQRIIKGAVLLGAVIFDVQSKNRKQAA